MGGISLAGVVDKLLEPAGPDDPCGPDPSYEPEFLGLERAILGRPETQVGQTIQPAEEPNWRQIRQGCEHLLVRSKHLRPMIWWTVAGLEIDSFEGLADGLRLVRESLEKFWDHFHPRLAAAENNDPTERLNIVSGLAAAAAFGDPMRLRQRLLQAPLCSVRGLGHVLLRHALRGTPILEGSQETDDGSHAASHQLVQSVLSAMSPQDLLKAHQAVVACLDHLESIEKVLEQKLGDHSCDLGPARALLTGARTFLAPCLEQRGLEGSPSPEVSGVEASTVPGTSTNGEVRTIQDASRMLEKITRFYRAHHPSSPVPLFLEGARRVADKNYLEISQLVPPEAVRLLAAIAGLDNDRPGSPQ